ncbi:division/outer membrane stress-associated lipid-binding lipoprotein [Gallaecimonas kandeliae]|uniref:division/outer membrane stress-associated lipid-binding lipoprotein n=1 Tax=Gallaecimonas kandeliae TaxID=3029055 RepID=UPI002649C6A6|nr:division/outer membrane stress-associated lipid-binding lipoprotein [Gallaecimonas kandeliae]WKE66071.1 division/outer membrane stress-associated lipid-binding lipoprotein [Gallaecimonas kandeliae]
MNKAVMTACLMATMLLQGCAVALVAGAAGTASVANDRRTVGAYIDDESIELKITGIISSDPELRSNTHVSVVSMNGEVLLVGQAPGEALRTRIVSQAQKVPGVSKVNNQIRLMTPTRLSTRTHDTWLTSVVKGKLIASDLDSSAVKVVTENAEVFLMGLVSHQEGDSAANIARNVSGVTRVVKVFQYR